MDDRKTINTANVICPYCGYVFKESYELFDPNDEVIEVDCGACESIFRAIRDVKVRYSTSTLTGKVKIRDSKGEWKRT